MRSRALVIVVAMAVGLPGGSALAAPPAEPRAGAPAPVRSEPRPGDRMVQVGVGLVVTGLLGYGLMAAGLGIGNRAEADLVFLSERDDVAARRDVLARGQLGNRLAIAGAVTATTAMAVGIPLIAVGRRRHEASLARLTIGGPAGSLGLRVFGRF